MKSSDKEVLEALQRAYERGRYEATRDLADEAWGRGAEARSDKPKSWRDVARWLRAEQSKEAQ